MKTKTASVIIILMICFLPCLAQKSPEQMVWIDQSNPDAVFLQASAQKKHVPFQFTNNKETAKYYASVSQTDIKGTALHGFYGIGHPDMVTLVLSVTDKKGTIIYGYTCKKAGIRGQQSAADCLAKHWAESLKKK